MPFENSQRPRIEETVNFEFKGQELAARVYVLPVGSEVVDEDFDDSDWELGEVIECIDSVTGEKIKVTEGMKAAIVLALREGTLEAEKFQEKEMGETGHMRYFKPTKNELF